MNVRARLELNTASVAHRLITMRKSIGQLESAGRVDLARLAQNPAHGVAVERILASLDDVAWAINRHVCAALLGLTPATPELSYRAACRTGLIDEAATAALTPDEGPFNVLVQLALDSEPAAVEAIVDEALAAYREYVRQVTTWTGE